MVRDSADDGRLRRIINDHVANADSLHIAHWNPGRSAHTPAQAQKDGCVDNIAHGDVRDGDIFQPAAINRFQGETAAVVKSAVRNRNILKTAVGFRAELDSTGSVPGRHEGTVEQGALFVAAHLAVRNGNVLCRARDSESVRAFQTDTVVARGIDRAIGNSYVAAAVDIYAIAVGIDLQVVDGEVVDSRC